MPGRVIVYPTGATPKPDFKSDGATASVLAPFVIGSPEGVLLATGDGTVGVPAGTYDLLLLQGTEYESVRKSVTVGTDAVTEVDVTLEHTVKTGGWLAADMHIHTRQSFDSKLLAAHRVISEVASGVQVIVPTEHGYHYDLTSILKTLDYGVRAVSIPGSEYNFQGGHAGIYLRSDGTVLGSAPVAGVAEAEHGRSGDVLSADSSAGRKSAGRHQPSASSPGSGVLPKHSLATGNAAVNGGTV